MHGKPFRHSSESLNTNASTNGTAFRCRGNGVIGVLVTCPDTTSADGEFYIQVSYDGINFQSLDVPVLSKVAGTALSREQLLSDKPGARWARVRYVRSAGGAASEATLEVTCW